MIEGDWLLWLGYASAWAGGAGLALIVSGPCYLRRFRKVEAQAKALECLVTRQHERYCRMLAELDGHKARIRDLSAALARADHPEVGRNGLAAGEPADPTRDDREGNA